MAKIKQPIKEFWKSDEKPDYLQISKRIIKKIGKDDFTHNVKFVRKKIKTKKLGILFAGKENVYHYKTQRRPLAGPPSFRNIGYF